MRQSENLLLYDATRDTWCSYANAFAYDCDSAEIAQQRSQADPHWAKGFYFPPNELAKFDCGEEAQAFYKSKEFTVKKQ